MKQSIVAASMALGALGASAETPNKVNIPFDSGFVTAVQSGQYGSGVGAGIVLGDTQKAVGLSLTHLQEADHFNMSGAVKAIPGVLGTAGLRLTRADASAVFGNDILDKKVTAGEGSVGLKLEGVGRLNSFSVTGVRQKGKSENNLGGSVDFSEVIHAERVPGATNFYSNVYEHTTRYSATGKTQDGVRTGLNLDIGKSANLLAGYEKMGNQRTVSVGPEFYGNGWNLTALVNQTKSKGQDTKSKNDTTTSLSGTVRISPTAQLAAGVVLDKKAKVQNAFVGVNIVTDPIGVSGKPTTSEQMGADYSVRSALASNLDNIVPLYGLETEHTSRLASSTLIGTEYDPKPEVIKPPVTPEPGVDAPTTITLDATNITTTSFLVKCGITDVDGATGTCTLKESDGTLVSSWSIGADMAITGLTPDTTYILILEGTAKNGQTGIVTPISQNKTIKTLAEVIVPPADPAPVSAPIPNISTTDNAGIVPIVINLPTVTDSLSRTVTCIAENLPSGLTLVDNNTISGIHDSSGGTPINATRKCDAGNSGNQLTQPILGYIDDIG